MKILYKLTTRSRPDKMFACIENIRDMAAEKDPWIIVSMDKNDPASYKPEVWNRLSSYPLTFIYGVSRNKIYAFNRDVPKDGWDIIVPTSDDIVFKPGFDEIIKADAREVAEREQINIADMDFTLWYGDGAVHDKIMTVPIMTRKYYERLGYVYNPVYNSLFCDEEAIYVGEKLGKIYYSSAEIMEHMHPAWGKGVWDPQYRFTDSFYHIDKKIFDQRKALNFPL